ncbi:MAG: hypothetical protein JXR48_02125 [Candidatus Delongbacteria bacterium]|nr:hypothetical protein [Candidatus Delongbacteria bacterium]MBN2833743.1 hypothetical protein [Candidatus Delongbacteria bacterium]
MKKIEILVIVALSMIMLVSCGDDNSTETKSVYRLKTKSVVDYENKESSNSYMDYEYNGNRLSKINWTGYEDEFSINFSYDGSSKVPSLIDWSVGDVSIRKHKYEIENELVKNTAIYRFDLSAQQLYLHDSLNYNYIGDKIVSSASINGNNLEWAYIDGKLATFFNYNQEEAVCTYNADGKISSIRIGDDEKYEYLYENGLLKKDTWLCYDSDLSEWIIRLETNYSYSNSLLTNITLTRFFYNQNYEEVHTYYFEYDSNNNLVKMSIYSNDEINEEYTYTYELGDEPNNDEISEKLNPDLYLTGTTYLRPLFDLIKQEAYLNY